jgi:DNA-binding LacI/PurR family transcriptional regulator
MATMNDVARVAQVSIATVSHVINGTRFVSPERVERVQSAMRELDYTPDATARSLRVGRTNTIGLVIPDNSNPFFAELARRIEEAGFDAGYTTILGNSGERPDREHQYVSTLVSKRIDGLIIAPFRAVDRALTRLLLKAPIPTVVIDREDVLPTADVVLHDDAGGGRQAAQHLLELGHREIACVADPPHDAPSPGRLEGFLQALAAAGVDVPDDAIVQGDYHFESGREATRRLLATGRRFTALFAANDLMAAGAIREALAHGLRVPEDLSVVGFDDAPLAEMISPALTTVRQPLQQMGDTAVSLLLARMDAGEAEPRSRQVLPTSLVVRDSTAAPRA